MKTLKIKIDCGEKTCGECLKAPLIFGKPVICPKFDKELWVKAVTGETYKPNEWEVYRCPACLAAERKD